MLSPPPGGDRLPSAGLSCSRRVVVLSGGGSDEEQTEVNISFFLDTNTGLLYVMVPL